MNSNDKRPTIKRWAEEDRPREKMLEKGASELTNTELLAILIGSGTKEMTAVDLAKIVLENARNDLGQLGKLTIRDLCEIKGIGEAKAVTVAAALELGRRRKETDKPKIERIITPNDIYELFAPRLAELRHEELWMICLSASKTVISKDCMSKGGVEKVVSDVKLIVKNALNNLANSVALVHNHPSGIPNPSKDDIELTNRLQIALNYFSIALIDHVIVARTSYYSFANEGLV